MVVGVITPPPLVAENFVCSNSNFSPTGAITPDHPPPPLVAITPPPPSENPVSAPATSMQVDSTPPVNDQGSRPLLASHPVTVQPGAVVCFVFFRKIIREREGMVDDPFAQVWKLCLNSQTRQARIQRGGSGGSNPPLGHQSPSLLL